MKITTCILRKIRTKSLWKNQKVDADHQNILVLKDGSIRIIDFDCSCFVSEECNLIAQQDEKIFKMFEELRRKRDPCNSCSP